jgi:hypothetical protein
MMELGGTNYNTVCLGKFAVMLEPSKRCFADPKLMTGLERRELSLAIKNFIKT